MFSLYILRLCVEDANRYRSWLSGTHSSLIVKVKHIVAFCSWSLVPLLYSFVVSCSTSGRQQKRSVLKVQLNVLFFCTLAFSRSSVPVQRSSGISFSHCWGVPSLAASDIRTGLAVLDGFLAIKSHYAHSALRSGRNGDTGAVSRDALQRVWHSFRGAERNGKKKGIPEG